MTHIQQSTTAGKVVLENADDYSIRAEWVGTDQTESLRYVSGSDTAVHPHYWPAGKAQHVRDEILAERLADDASDAIAWYVHCLEGSR